MKIHYNYCLVHETQEELERIWNNIISRPEKAKSIILPVEDEPRIMQELIAIAERVWNIVSTRADLLRKIACMKAQMIEKRRTRLELPLLQRIKTEAQFLKELKSLEFELQSLKQA